MSGEWEAAMSTEILHEQPVLIWTGKDMLDGRLSLPRRPEGIVLISGLGGTFHHASIRSLARRLVADGYGTVIADLLTPDEQQFDARTGHYRMDTTLLAQRMDQIVQWIRHNETTSDLPVAIVATSATTSAAAQAASKGLRPFAMVLNTPRLEVIRHLLEKIDVPTLVLMDEPSAFRLESKNLGQAGRVEVVRGVSSLLEDDEVSDEVATESVLWFRRHASYAVSA